MDIRRFKPLRAAGATYKEIADEVGVDWRTVREYLAEDALTAPPAPPRRAGTQVRKIDPLAPVVDAWLTADLRLRASVIHERLVADYGFDGHYLGHEWQYSQVRSLLAGKVRSEDDGRQELALGWQGCHGWGRPPSAEASRAPVPCNAARAFVSAFHQMFMTADSCRRSIDPAKTLRRSQLMDWRHRSACRDQDPELFFPIGTTGPARTQVNQAKAVCRRCEVREDCLAWAMRSGQDSGVWGGLSDDERRALKRRARVGARA